MGATGKTIPVSEPVRKAHERGWSVIPLSPDKRSYIKWKKYQTEQPTSRDITEWHERWPNCRWAFLTGQRSVIVLDFDGEEGLETLKRLKLKPTVRTPSGGAHVWITGVEWRVVGGSRVDEKFPGMDLRADGQIAVFAGRGYKVVGGTLEWKDAPLAIQSLLKKRKKTKQKLAAPTLPDDFDDFAEATTLLAQALSRLEHYPRNETGFWLACQLRDERYPQREAEAILQQYAGIVASNGDHPYTSQEAYTSVASAYSQPARLPRGLQEENAITLVSEIEEEKLEWFWRPRIPLGKVTVIEGDPDRGKTLISTDLAARVTRGFPMPGGSKKTPVGSVVLMTAEDDLGDTVKPRLLAAGANVKRVAFIPLEKDEKGNVIPLSIPDDLAKVRRAIRSTEAATRVPVRLLIIDPITAYLSERIHSANDAQVRKAMMPLKQLAEETNIAVVLIRHLNKDGSMRAMYRGGGSIAFTAAARSVLVAERQPDKDNMYVLARVKGNLARASKAITYQIARDAERNAPKIDWGKEFDIDVDTLLRGDDGRKDAPARREAEAFLTAFLADGPHDAKEIFKSAGDVGISKTTLKNAKKSLGIRARPIRKDGPIVGWRWELRNYLSGGILHFDRDA
jgi:archaellum biogenesis ATPase FlaH